MVKKLAIIREIFKEDHNAAVARKLTRNQISALLGMLNYTNFKSNLATMVIYLPVKFEFDWTKCFRVRVRKQKC